MSRRDRRRWKRLPWFANAYSKEDGWVRRMTRRNARHDAKAAIRHERFEDADQRQKSTQGWITW